MFEEIGYTLSLWKSFFKENYFNAEQEIFFCIKTGLNYSVHLEDDALLKTGHSKGAIKCNKIIVTNFTDECPNMIYTVEHEAVMKDDDSYPNEKRNNRRNIIRRLNVMQVGIKFFLPTFDDTICTTKGKW